MTEDSIYFFFMFMLMQYIAFKDPKVVMALMFIPIIGIAMLPFLPVALWSLERTKK